MLIFYFLYILTQMKENSLQQKETATLIRSLQGALNGDLSTEQICLCKHWSVSCLQISYIWSHDFVMQAHGVYISWSWQVKEWEPWTQAVEWNLPSTFLSVHILLLVVSVQIISNSEQFFLLCQKKKTKLWTVLALQPRSTCFHMMILE